MTAVRLALTELRRIAASRVGRLALIAMVLVPSIYAGLYLYANDDPYGRLSEVPAALVVEDAGTTLSTGERMQLGDDVAKEVLDAGTFDWHRTDRAAAERGLRAGTYDLVLAVPASFSGDIASSSTSSPRQATLEIQTNDANNYLARTIANSLVKEVTSSVAAQVSNTAASRFLEGFADIRAQVTEASSGAKQLAAGAAQAHDGAGQLASGADDLVAGEKKLVTGSDALASGAGDLADGLGTLRSSTASLPSQSAQLAAGARQVADGNAKIAALGKQVAGASGQLSGSLAQQRAAIESDLLAAGLTQAQVDRVLTRLDGLATPVTQANTRIQQASSQLNALASGSAQVADGADRLAAAAPALTAGIGKAADGSATLASGARDLAAGQRTALSGAEQLASGAHRLDSGLADLDTGAAKLAAGLAKGADAIPPSTEAQRRAMAETIGNPVGVQREAGAEATTYGAGLAPFFLSLSMWIGGFVLFTRMRALSSRALAAGQPAWRISLGGWLAPAALGVLQAGVALAVVAAGVGLDVAHPVLLVGFLAVVSMTFMAMIHALMARLGVVGQFVALVLMVVQLVSAGGTFPWQTLPDALHPLHRALPMSYAVDGVRRLMYDGPMGPLGLDLLVLAAWALGAMALAAFAARKASTWSARRIKPELTA